ARRVEERVRAWPEVKSVFSTVGTGGGNDLAASQARFARLTIELVKPGQRTKTEGQLAVDARSLVEGVPGATIRVSQPGFVDTGGAAPVYVVVSGDDDATLTELAQQIEAVVRRVPGTTDVTDSAAVGSPEMTVTVD